MKRAKCINKFRDISGNITGYRLQDTFGNTYDAKAKDVKTLIRSRQLDVVNLTLTSDGRLIDAAQDRYKEKRKAAIEANKEVYEDEDMILSKPLYHGSQNPILVPEYGRGEDRHDYGKGLYLTDDIELAREWAVYNPDEEKKSGYVFEVRLDIHDLAVLDYTEHSELNWLAEIMSHRDAWDSAKYRKLAPLFIAKYKIDTASSDLIQGWRADASYFAIAKAFVRDELDVKLLNRALYLGDMGMQYCIKSPKAFDSVVECNLVETVAYEEYNNKYNERHTRAWKEFKELLESPENTLETVFSQLI